MQCYGGNMTGASTDFTGCLGEEPKLSVDMNKWRGEVFDVSHLTTQHTAFLCICPVKSSSTSLLSMTQRGALVMEKCAVHHAARRWDMEDRWDGLPTQYTVRGLKDLVIDTVLLQSIIQAISYSGDKWRYTVNSMIEDVCRVNTHTCIMLGSQCTAIL